MNSSSPSVRQGVGEPYGGKLVELSLPQNKAEEKAREAHEMPKLKPFDDFLYDTEKIGIGAYSPLEGFMNEETFSSVISEGRLPNGLPWTIPIILAPGNERAKPALEVREGDDLALLDWQESPFAILHVGQKFSFSKELLASSVYGTRDAKHPNVSDILEKYGSTALGGKISLIRRLRLPGGRAEPTPRETRRLFRDRGWRNVVAYQCRNPPHTAHEYLQRCALENADIDGLFIHPVVGRLKRGDYRPEIILEAYEAAVERYYPKKRVLLSPLYISMRYAGPKAALFLAIVRKNYGATHYIVGRDQAGVGNYYEPSACHRIFDDNDNTCPHPSESRLSVSQTKLRGLLSEGKELPSEIIRPEVAKILSRPDVVLT